jgi:hypothetical protein
MLPQSGSSSIGSVHPSASVSVADGASPVTPHRHTLADYFSLFEPALEICDDAFLVLFALPGTRTFATRDINEAVDISIRWAIEGLNVYLHINLHILPQGEGKRGCKETTRVAIGLFSDIDAQGPGRKKSTEALCPSVHDAIRIAEEFNSRMVPLGITLFIGSGYGCYPTVLFKEPFIVGTPGDRQLLETLGLRFHCSLQQIACEHGWNGAVDRCDLAKVLRLPGTINFKDPANPRIVRILEKRDTRFTLMDLDELLPPLPESQSSTNGWRPNQAAAGLIFNPNALPPDGKFDLLCEIDPKFLLTWNHQRDDLKDTSQSGYDLSLAIRAVDAGWTDQEMLDLIIANRRMFHGKQVSNGYFLRTIARARAAVLRRQEQAEQTETEEPTEQRTEPASGGEPHSDPGQTEGATDGMPQTDKEKKDNEPKKAAVTDQSAALDFLSHQFRFRVHHILKYASEPAEYRMQTEYGEVKIKSVQDLISQAKLRARIVDAIQRDLPDFSRKKWPKIRYSLVAACEKVEASEDSTERGIMAGWLSEYLNTRAIHDTIEEADKTREPFWHNDGCCIYVSDFKRWSYVQREARLTQPQITAQLRDFGAVPVRETVMIEQKETSRGFWRLPPGPWIPERRGDAADA